MYSAVPLLAFWGHRSPVEDCVVLHSEVIEPSWAAVLSHFSCID